MEKGLQADPGTINRMLITPEEDNQVPFFLYSAGLYRLSTLCQGLCPRDTSLSLLVTSTSFFFLTSTSLLNVSISPCLLSAPRESTGVSSRLSEFCGKDKMQMLLLLQVFNVWK